VLLSELFDALELLGLPLSLPPPQAASKAASNPVMTI
jgi:hypothetical protein